MRIKSSCLKKAKLPESEHMKNCYNRVMCIGKSLPLNLERGKLRDKRKRNKTAVRNTWTRRNVCWSRQTKKFQENIQTLANLFKTTNIQHIARFRRSYFMNGYK